MPSKEVKKPVSTHEVNLSASFEPLFDRIHGDLRGIVR